MASLSLRLETILSLIEETKNVADIGADHGLLSVEIIKRNIASNVFAVENKKGPFSRLEKVIKDNNLEEKIIASFSSGISSLPSIFKTVVIAGMGGRLIVDILKSHPSKVDYIETLILDGHSDLEYLRKEVTKLGYYIDLEVAIEEDKVFYEIIRLKKGQSIYIEDDYRFGPILRTLKPISYINKWKRQMKKYLSLLNDSNISILRKKQLENEIERINKNI